MRGGEYRGVNGLGIPKTLTLRAYPGEMPWLLGSDIVTGWTKNGAVWSTDWEKKFTFEPPKDGDPRTIDKRFPRAIDLDLAFLDGKPLVQVAALEEVKAGTFWTNAAAKKIHLGDDPTGKKVEVSAREWGIATQGKGKSAPDITIRGLAFAHHAKTGAQLFANGARIENCLAAWNGENGFGMRGKNVVIKNSVAIANGRKGVGISKSEGARIEGNTVFWNNVERFRTAWDAAGLKITRTKDALFIQNRFENNFSSALWMDISVMNARIVQNTVKDNAGIGIFVELQHDSIVAFNVCARNGTGIQIADSSEIHVWNNTLVGNVRAILIKDSMRVNKPGSVDTTGLGNVGTAEEDAAAGATWESHSNVFKNNLFIGPKAGEKAKPGALFDAGQVHPDKSSLEMMGESGANFYVLNASKGAVKWKPQKNGEQKTFATLDEFRAANASLENGSIVAASVPFADADFTPTKELPQIAVAWPENIVKAAREAGISLDPAAPFVGAISPP